MSFSLASVMGDDFPSGPLTDLERRALRRIIRDDDRMRWLWPFLREWGGWMIAVGGALWAIYEFAWRHVKFTP